MTSIHLCLQSIRCRLWEPFHDTEEKTLEVKLSTAATSAKTKYRQLQFFGVSIQI